MAYDLKSVFYLDTSAEITKSTAGVGSAQLDLSAYIDPIARGRTKGTGLAIYKVHWSMLDADNTSKPWDDAEVGTMQAGLIAGAGVGDAATGAGATMASGTFSNTNNLMISNCSFFGPKSQIANANTPLSAWPNTQVDPSIEVPYVIVRDNVCILYMVGENFVDDYTLSVRLECAQISLDQATLNQLLRTQTV
jgi:hypothetical protein